MKRQEFCERLTFLETSSPNKSNMLAIVRNTSDAGLDPFYKMPKVTTRSFKGDTLLTNIDDVSKAIHEDVVVVLNHFKKKLGTSVRKLEQGHALKGEHFASDIQLAIQDYIEAHVLCPACDLPELLKRVGHRPKCEACGHKVK